MDIEELELDVRGYYAMKNLGIQNTESLINGFTKEKLLATKFIGPKTLSVIEYALAQYGLRLRSTTHQKPNGPLITCSYPY